MTYSTSENDTRMLAKLSIGDVAFIAEALAEGITPAIKFQIILAGNGASSTNRHDLIENEK